ncbi:MAG: MmcB family DNA repair protein [Parasphingorhabdus sp.]|nr:MmcB family DNA repair protein [Parasphingorhabdus sp.]
MASIATPFETAQQTPVNAAAVARGVTRMFHHHGVQLLPEVPLRNGRRVDLMGLDAKGGIVIVEIKTAKADLLGDHKWTEYLDYCDRFYWAVPEALDPLLLAAEIFQPERSGLVIADGYGAEIVRAAATVPVAPARRKTETLMLARRTMQRLSFADGRITDEDALRDF